MSQAGLTDATQDNPKLFKALMDRPVISWPTVFLCFAAFGLFGAASYAYLTGALSLAWAIGLNTIASYMSFTVVHEASHSGVSTNRRVNDWFGRIGMLLLEPTPIFKTFRAIHMQHHKFTNDPKKDPDFYAGSGPFWLLPFKWVTLDVAYFHYYLAPNVFKKRPKGERVEFFIGLGIGVAMVTAATLSGWLDLYLLLFFIPTRIVKFILGSVFDYLPHYPHKAQSQKAPFQSTSNRIGREWLLTPLFVYQNYHLVHHLYPTVPFYRYLKVWAAKKNYHLTQNPALVQAFSLKPKTK